MAARSRVSIGPGQLALPDPQAERLAEVERELTATAETLARVLRAPKISRASLEALKCRLVRTRDGR